MGRYIIRRLLYMFVVILVVSLITFLETKEKFRINPIDVSLDNLDSISRILSFLEKQSTKQ